METETQSVLRPQVIDALVQTEDSTQQSASCQTDTSEKTDVEIQVDLQSDKNTIGTQAIKQENTEIAMPNKPTSMSTNPSKKRKLSSVQSHQTCDENKTSKCIIQKELTLLQQIRLAYKKQEDERKKKESEDAEAAIRRLENQAPKQQKRKILKEFILNHGGSEDDIDGWSIKALREIARELHLKKTKK